MSRSLTGIRADRSHSYYSIEQMATGLRKMLSLDPLDCFNALKFFDEVIPEMTIECNAGAVSICEALDDFPGEGRTKWDARTKRLEIALTGETYALLRLDHPRARYTVAHEAGHVCLHTDQIIRMGEMPLTSQVALHRSRDQHEAYQDTEWQANAFGSALLMPATGVERIFKRLGRTSATALVEAYGVSIESASYRIETYERALGVK